MLPFSDEELFMAIEVIISKIKPTLALDGGDVKLLGVEKGKVFVQLQGACVGCSSSDITLKHGIERKIKSEIHSNLEVINIPFGVDWRSK